MPLPRSIELKIRAVIVRVHERRMAESLAQVEQAIARWRDGSSTVFDVDDVIRQHQNRAKHFWNLYANSAATSPEVHYILDEALKLGLISQTEHHDFLHAKPSRKKT